MCFRKCRIYINSTICNIYNVICSTRQHGRVGGAVDDTIIQEMIRIAIQRLSKKQNHPHVTKKKILKVLFQAKGSLPHENPVKSHLAYYWYKDGPYSEKIYAGIDQLVQDGVIIDSVTESAETYRLAPERALLPLVEHDDHIDEAGSDIRRTVREGAHTGRMIRDIYAAAPFKLYGAYNLGFKPRFESHCDAVLNERKNRYNNGDILNLLDDAVLAYPAPPKFIEHRRMFMDFVKMLNAFLMSDASSARTDLLKTLLVLSRKVWDVFAYGVRIDHHDPYYDDRVDGWTYMYKQKLVRLDTEIRAHTKTFETSVVDHTRLAPDVEAMILHPEKHEFTPVVLDAIPD